MSHRLRNLQNELAALETELADPSNPQLAQEREEENVDPGELIRGLVDVKSRLEKINKGKEGRGRLVNVVLGNGEVSQKVVKTQNDDEEGEKLSGKRDSSDVRSIVEMDRRVAELEKLVGSSTAALDEVSTATNLGLPVLIFVSDISSPTPTSSIDHPSQLPDGLTDTTSSY